MKKVLITGSSTGIGFECAKYFMDNGFSGIAHYFEKNENVPNHQYRLSVP